MKLENIIVYTYEIYVHINRSIRTVEYRSDLEGSHVPVIKRYLVRFTEHGGAVVLRREAAEERVIERY